MRPFLIGPPNKEGALQPRGEVPLTEMVKDTAGDLVTLVTAEVKLARLELLAGARQAVGRAGWMAVGAVPLVVAYLLGVGALAVWLHRFWGWAGGLAATAVAQAIVGGAVLWTIPSSTPSTSTSNRSRSEPVSDYGESHGPRRD